MPETAREIITLAFKESGVLGIGQTLLAEDINDGLTYLQRMVDTWQKKRWLIPSLTEYTIACDGSISYTIGPGGNLDIIRPSKFSAVWVIQNNTGSTPVSMPLAPLFSYEDYALIATKNLTSLPYLFFYDNSWPLGNLFPWPIPSNLYTLYLLIQQQLNFILSDLDIEQNLARECELPPEYLEAIHYNLALRLCSAYQTEPMKQTVRLARSSLATLRMVNVQVPRMLMPTGIVGKKRGFNLYNPDGYGYG